MSKSLMSAGFGLVLSALVDMARSTLMESSPAHIGSVPGWRTCDGHTGSGCRTVGPGPILSAETTIQPSTKGSKMQNEDAGTATEPVGPIKKKSIIEQFTEEIAMRSVLQERTIALHEYLTTQPELVAKLEELGADIY